MYVLRRNFIGIAVLCLTMMIALLLVVTSSAAVVPSPSPTEGDAWGYQCPLINITQYQHFTDDERWHFDHNSCGFSTMATDELVSVMKGKSILFIGDSSVRNTGLSLLASMCNPEHQTKCDQIMTLPFIQREGTTVSAFRCGENSPSNRCGEIRHRFTPLANLTMQEFYKTHEERRKFWKTKNVPPLLSMSFRGVDIHILEAGCSNHRDGLWLVLDYLLRFNVPFRYDMIVLSGGLHCSYRVYKGGTWYRSLFERFPKFKAMGIPLIWLEVTNCLKNDGGHYFKLEGKWTLNYRKLAACPFIDKHIPFMRSGAIRNGASYVYTRHITQNLTLLGKSKSDKSYKFNEAQRNESCPFMDPIHPTVECYAAIAQSLAATIRTVVSNPASFRTLEPLPSKETLRESGAVQIGEDFMNRGFDEKNHGQSASSSGDGFVSAFAWWMSAYVQLLWWGLGLAVAGIITAGCRRRRNRKLMRESLGQST